MVARFFILNVGRRCRRPRRQVEKNAFRAGDIFGARRRVVVAGTCRLRQRPKGRSRSDRTAGPERRDRRRGSARPSRPVRPARAARRAGTTQSKLARHSQTMPDRKLRGVLQRQRSAGERLLRPREKSADIRGRTWDHLRDRGERRQYAARCDLRGDAATIAVSAWRAPRPARRKRPRRLSARGRDEITSRAPGAETGRRARYRTQRRTMSSSN